MSRNSWKLGLYSELCVSQPLWVEEEIFALGILWVEEEMFVSRNRSPVSLNTFQGGDLPPRNQNRMSPVVFDLTPALVLAQTFS